MKLKKLSLFMLIICLLLCGCSGQEANTDTAAQPQQQESSESSPAPEMPAEPSPEAETAQEPARSIYPLPDTTMDNLSDAILPISLEEGGAYVDDAGIMQMDVKIYSYDKYDMVDMAMLKVGDTLVTYAGEVKVESLERDANGTLCINGGLEAGGFDLVTDDTGIFFERGYNDAKSWYQVGEATLRVSVDFECRDNADPDQGELIYYPGSFLVGEVTNFYFSPLNTSIRVENGQIVEMNRVYIP